MKKIYLISIFILSTLFSNGQNNSEIFGHWKVVAYFDGELYFNLLNDSSSITEALLYLYPDTLERKKLILSAKQIMGSMQFHFDANGIFKQYLDTTFLFDGRYNVSSEKRTFGLTTALGEDMTDQIKYIIKDRLLQFSMKGDNKEFTLGLKKIN